jgi:hypothetical protein
VERSASGDGGSTVNDQPYFDVYPITQADPTLVLQVVTTLLAGTPDARVSLDPKTGALAVLARPSVHKTIKAIIDQMQHRGVVVEVIKLRRLDPQTAAQQIAKLFGGDTSASTSSSGSSYRSSTPAASTGGPRVEPDPVSGSLTIVGSQAQVDTIKAWLVKMGEAGAGPPSLAQETRQPFRMIPLGGRAGETALEQAARIWSAQHGNKVRIINPEADKSAEEESAAPPAAPRGPAPAPAGPRAAPEGKGKAMPRIGAPGILDRPLHQPPRLPTDVTRTTRPKVYYVSEPAVAAQPAGNDAAPTDATKEKAPPSKGKKRRSRSRQK